MSLSISIAWRLPLLGIVANLATDLAAEEKPRTMRHAGIHAEGHGFLDAGGKIRFRKGPLPETEWNFEFGKKGIVIYRSLRGSNGALLGIDAKTRELRMFAEAGPTTTWQIVYAQAGARGPHGFKGLLVMKLDGEELRLSVDDEGIPVMGGKATVLRVFVDGP